MFLQSKKLNATGVCSAAEALLAYDRNAFDVVVTDYSMPDKDGFELATDLRKLDSPPSLILITGLELSSQHEIDARRQFDAILIKPFRLERLASAIVATDKRADQ